ncbi:DUF3048 domain-containing protein [Bacillus thermotolerans]|uniref:DUF3048 domain-containing protein n=1 Tax=Bacillus thermotolerans TaxID=1221996 RepID=A0A0F5I466_BACTR|nr:DUF3048 domain-containing protein [Bacillus thermotolerans]KKB40040.1 hypothetical protein QY95_01912 [Bacillus thermotolerans]
MKKMVILSSIAGALLMSGCVSTEEKGTEEGSEQKAIQEHTKEYTFPLTGKPVKEQPEQRAVAVVINNHPKARPQTGLAEADIVYEVLTEGNITRFLAIYQSSQPEKAGPVRSARTYFIDLARGYDSLFIAHGYSPNARERLFSGEVEELNGIQYDGTAFERDPSRQAPHNSYIDFAQVFDKAEQRGYHITGAPDPLSFARVSQSAEGEAEAVRINYSSHPDFQVEYKYNAKTGEYERFSGGKQQFDRETDQPLSASNLLIIEAEHRLVDGQGRLDIDVSSGGKAYFLQGGAAYLADWSNVEGRILPFKDGAPISFAEGKTWIHVIPASKGLNQMVDVKDN